MSAIIHNRKRGTNLSKRYKGEILGTLQIQANNCTDTIKMHPINSGDWFLIPTDLTEQQKRHQYHATSLIAFDGRQVWEVYYFRFGDGSGWVVQRKGLYLRMPEKDFERFFGKYEILERQ